MPLGLTAFTEPLTALEKQDRAQELELAKRIIAAHEKYGNEIALLHGHLRLAKNRIAFSLKCLRQQTGETRIIAEETLEKSIREINKALDGAPMPVVESDFKET